MNDELTVLLVDISKDYITSVEGNKFSEALAILNFELEAWAEKTGVHITTLPVLEMVEDPNNKDDWPKSSRGHTRVYGVFNSKTDRAFYKLSMENFKPAWKVMHNGNDWVFGWHRG